MSGGKGGGGGGGQQQPTQSSVTQTTSNIPDYARPYFESILKQSQSLGTADYVPYSGDRIAPLNQTQNQALQGVQNAQGNYQPYFDQAAQNAVQAGQAGFGAAFQPGQVTNQYNASAINP